jgi:MYXO-CTERM domain-containing protein
MTATRSALAGLAALAILSAGTVQAQDRPAEERADRAVTTADRVDEDMDWGWIGLLGLLGLGGLAGRRHDRVTHTSPRV